MKKISAILSFTALLLCGCTVSELNDGRTDSPVFTASFEEMPGTKTYVDSDLYMYWNADDRLSIFTTTYNQQYKFSGKTGDNGGDFEEVAGGFHSGNSISTNYAVYPYSSTTSLTKDEKITLTMPADQDYAEGSFGLGASTMVAVTAGPSDYFLAFKNLCGFLVVKLYGEGTVKSVSIKGNNGEKLAGPATVTASHGSAPTLAFGDDATETITIDCGAGVVLGSDASHATEFWFCIPPVSFSKGFTITATNTEGWSMVKSTSKSREVERNIMTRMSAFSAVFDTKIGNVEFEDANFKAYCVENFDTDGDGEISIEEAEKVKKISVYTNEITSLAGIEYFSNLTNLYCRLSFRLMQHENDGKWHFYDANGNEVVPKLASLDVSNNTALTYLDCSGNQLTSLDVSKNTALTHLYCYCNQLTSLDVSKNTALTYLRCDGNQLTSLDVSKNTALKELDCYSNQLTSLDVSKNTALKELRCLNNQLTSLDVSKNTALTTLWCDGNQLTSLDVSNNTALKELDCYSNQLTSLDVSNNTSLTSLDCSGNQLTSLDVSKNTALTYLKCDGNQLTSLDVSKNTALTFLWCGNNQLSNLDVSENTALTYLNCGSNPYLTEVWLGMEQTISSFVYDTDVATIKRYGVWEAVDLGLSVKWATCNLGARSPEEYGDYYAWGETEIDLDFGWNYYAWAITGTYRMSKYCTDYTYGTVDNKTVLDLEDDVAHATLGGDWRMPTNGELIELVKNCTWTWTTQNNVNGYLVSSNTNSNSIFLPAAGYSLSYQVGSYGRYWSSTLYTGNEQFGYGLQFNISSVSHSSVFERYQGQSVRPVCEK